MTGLGMSIWEEGRAEGRIEGRLEGRLEGRVEEILDFLEEIGSVPLEVSEKVRQEQNLITLHQWIRLAARADTFEEFVRNM